MEDHKIIALFFARSELAISAAMERYRSYCLTIARKILPDERDAEECVQDVCMRLWDTIPPQQPRSLGAYLAQITRNLALDRYAYNHAEKRSTALTTAFEELEPFLTGSSDPAAHSEKEDFRHLLNGFLRQLPKEKRIIFVRRYFYGDSIREVANFCKCTEGKVRTILFRVRNDLKIILEKEGFSL